MTLHMKQATQRSAALVGGPTPHGEEGWCLEWVVRVVYGYQGPVKYRTAARIPTSRYWAINYWYAAKYLGKVVETSDPTKIPAGAMVCSKGSSKYGHIFISLGDGWCATTDYPRSRKIGRVKIADLMAGWGHKLLGYIEVTGDGIDLRNPGAPDKMDPDNYYLGAEGDHVLWLGQRLIAHGYPTRYKATRTFTTSDVKAVAWFQRQQGWSGPGADGYPGDETLKRLAADPPKKAATAPARFAALSLAPAAEAVRPYSKAVAAFVTTFAGSFGAALIDGHLERTEVLAALGLAIAATAGVYAAPANRQAA